MIIPFFRDTRPSSLERHLSTLGLGPKKNSLGLSTNGGKK